MYAKRIIAVILTCVLLFTACIPNVFAAQAGITVQTVTAEPGSTVDISITLNDNPGFVGMILTVNYDAALTLTGVTDSGLIPGQMHSTQYNANPYKLTWANDTAESNFTANGTLVVLHFKVAENAVAGMHPVTITYNYNNLDIMDVSFAPVSFELTGGGVNIKAAECTHANAYDVTATPATCTGAGLTAGRYCPDCGLWLVEQNTVDALGHLWSNWTKLDDNDHQRICSRDTSHKEQQAHVWDDGVLNGNSKVYSCTVCDATKTETIEPPEQGTGTLTVQSVTATQGGTADLTVTMADNPGFTGMILNVNYDAALTLTGITDSGLIPGQMHSPIYTANPYKLTWANDTATENIKANGVIVTLHFNVAEDASEGMHPVTISYNYNNLDIVNVSIQPVSFNLTGGGVTVEKAVCAHTNAYEVAGKDPTCTAAGLTAGFFCPDCGVWLTPQKEIPALEHQWGAWTKLNDDEHVRVCARDSSHREQQAHVWDAGVLNGNVKTYTCSVCNGTKTETVSDPQKPGVLTVQTVTAAAGNTVDVDITVADNPGFVGMILEVNYNAALTLTGVTDSGLIPGQMHSANYNANPYKLTWANDTATENITANGVIATLHFKVSEQASEGLLTVSLAYSYNNLDIADVSMNPVSMSLNAGGVRVTHAHDFSVLKSDGEYHWYACANGCSEISGKEKHSGGTATCTEKAKCTVCGAEYGSVLGHSFTVLKTDDEYHWYECANGCGATENKLAHTFGDWTVTKEATETEEGEKERACTVCSYKQTESIPKTQTAYEGPCVFAAIKEIEDDTVTVGIYLRDCKQFISADFSFTYDPAVMEPVPDEDSGREMTEGSDLQSFELNTYGFGCNTAIPGIINVGLYFYDAQDIDGVFEYGLITFELKSDAPAEIALQTKIGSYYSLDDTQSIPDAVTAVYDTDTKQVTVTVSDVPDVMLGDVDGDGRLTAADARLALRASVGLENFSVNSKEFIACDVDGDGVITAGDARRILRAAVGLEDPSLFGTPDETDLAQQGTFKLVYSVDGDEYCVDLYAVNCIGLKSANLELLYDPDVLEFDYVEDGDAVAEIAKARDHSLISDYCDTDPGRILVGFYFKQVLMTVDEYAAASRDPSNPANVNSEFLHVISFHFNINPNNSYGFHRLPEIQFNILSSSGIAPFKHEDVMLGDVDGDYQVTASDARLTLRRAVDLEDYPKGSYEFIACDVNRDGKVTADDARSILRAAVQLEDPSLW